MTTNQRWLFLASLLLAAACGGEPPMVVDDQSWDDLPSAQRRAHLETKIADSLETLQSTADGPTWHASADDARRALSLLRVEGGLDDPVWGEASACEQGRMWW